MKLPLTGNVLKKTHSVATPEIWLQLKLDIFPIIFCNCSEITVTFPPNIKVTNCFSRQRAHHKSFFPLISPWLSLRGHTCGSLVGLVAVVGGETFVHQQSLHLSVISTVQCVQQLQSIEGRVRSKQNPSTVVWGCGNISHCRVLI